MYNQHRIYRVFQLINQLQAGPGKSSGSLAKMLGVTVRSVYRYLDLLEQLGFRVEKDAHGKFFLANQGTASTAAEDQEGLVSAGAAGAPYSAHMTEALGAVGSFPFAGASEESSAGLQHSEGLIDVVAAGRSEAFTPQESSFLAQLVQTAGRDHPLAEGVLLKVRQASELEVGARMVFRAHLAKAVEALSYAIQHKRQVVLLGYYSANSQTHSDRRVEPQCFTDNFATLSAYEPTSGINKYFRVERISAVEVLPDAMEHEEKHAYFKPDVFGFQEQHEPLEVEWTMTLRASLLLQEEYPMSRALVVPANEPGRYRFSATVYSYKGPGRFVLGFLDDVDVLGSDGFRKYLRGVARSLF
jgi:predicted DNA-binding transcriptional regulator YafY